MSQKHPLDSFIDFIEKKNPNYCRVCLGGGLMEFRGAYVSSVVKCSACDGTGNKKPAQNEHEV